LGLRMKKTVLVKVKVKVILGRTVRAWSGISGTAVHFLFNFGARSVGWSTPNPSRLTPRKETRYPLYRRVGRTHGLSGRVRKTEPPP